MSVALFASLRTKPIISIICKASSIIRSFSKEDDRSGDGGVVDGGGSWAERERALEGMYIRKLVCLQSC